MNTNKRIALGAILWFGAFGRITKTHHMMKNLRIVIVVVIAGVAIVAAGRISDRKKSNAEQEALDREAEAMPPTWKQDDGKDYKQAAIDDAARWLEIQRRSLERNEEDLALKKERLGKETHPGKIALLTEEMKESQRRYDESFRSVRSSEERLDEAIKAKRGLSRR